MSIAACDEGSKDATLPSATTVCAIADREIPPGRKVTVRGRAWALPPQTPDTSFALSADGCSVLIAGERFEVVDAREGEHVEVLGLIHVLEPPELRLLARQRIARPARLRLSRAPDLSLDVGTPFVSAFAVTGEAHVPN